MKKQVKRRNASKLRATETSRLWRLAHRKHSGHILPRRNTSYPVLVMIVLCMGVFMAGWTHVATAVQSYDVSARVAGPAPTIPATIDLPLNGTTTSTKPISVSGTCPQSTYVELFRNNFSSGIALCDASGHYSISTDLFIGANQLIARVYSFSDTPGPDSAGVNVTYAPIVATSEAEESKPEAVTQQIVEAEKKSPIRLSSDFTYIGYEIGEKIKWTLDIRGGVSPYAVSVDWGDGKNDIYTQKEDGQLTISHRYKKSGGFKGSYQINVKIIDTLGSSSSLQLMAIVNPAAGTGAVGSIKSLSPDNGAISSDQLGQLIRYAWPTYGVVVLMLTSFWLGETHELTNLKKIRHKSRSR